MALTDNEKAKKDKRKRRALEATGSRYSDGQKIEAVTTWLAVGNMALAARLLGIPEITLRVWKTHQWWQDTVEDIKLSENIQLSARMKKLVEASQNIVAQRLESGDPILNQKTGEIIYKPVSMKDAHKVSVDLMDRKNVLDKLTKGEATDASDDNKLEKLAEKFAEMATKSIKNQLDKRRTVDAEDVVYHEEDNDAMDEEREEGLQARVRTVSGSSRSNQEEVGEDDGEASS